MVVINSFKVESAISTSTAFQLPTAEQLRRAWTTLPSAIGSQGFLAAFFNSLVISVTSVVLILICCSMCAWFITRVNSKVTQAVLLSVRVLHGGALPDADVYAGQSGRQDCNLNTPLNICIVYLGFGAGLAVFMFCGFMKSIPLEIEEAAMIDGCGPIRTFFLVVLPMLKPTLVSVGILETMWVWNDYLLPYLVLDTHQVYDHPHSGTVSSAAATARWKWAPMMACIVLTILPIIIILRAGPEAHHQGCGCRRREGIKIAGMKSDDFITKKIHRSAGRDSSCPAL